MKCGWEDDIEMNLIVARVDCVSWFKVTSMCLLANTELRYFGVEILIVCMLCSVYSVFIVPTVILRLP